MLNDIYYCVRHIPTGQFMPPHKERTLAATRWDPSVKTSSYVPRVFLKKHHAKSAVNFWLKGILHENEFGAFYRKIKSRNESDLEIIPVIIMIAHQTEPDT